MLRSSLRWIFVMVALPLLAATGPVPPGRQQRDPPSDVALDAAVEAATRLPRLHSLLVNLGGELLVEKYFNGTRPTSLANIKSASKSVLSALVGIAIDRKLIVGVEAPIAPYFPNLLKADPDRRKFDISVEDLLTMRSGLRSTSGRNYGAWVQSANWVQHVLSSPTVSRPGVRMDYSTGDSHLLSAILTKVSGKSTLQFAREVLAKPLGITLASWLRDPQGIYFGGNEMQMTPRQMLAFGQLYLNRGKANGQQVVSSEWVDASFVPRTRSNWSDQMYGYGWWVRKMAGHQAYYAWGYGGQYIFVVPDLELVVVMTSSPNPSEERRAHTRGAYDLVERLVIAPISSAREIASQSSGGD